MVRFINDLPLLGKLSIPFIVVLGLVGLLIWQSYTGLITMKAASDEAIDVAAKRLELALLVQSDLNAAAVAEKNVILADNDQERRGQVEYYNQVMGKATSALTTLLQMPQSAERRAVNEQVRTAVQAYGRASGEVIAKAMAGDIEGAEQVSNTLARVARRDVVRLTEERVEANRAAML